MTKSGGVSVPTSDDAGDALLHHSIDSAGYTRCSGTSNNIDDAENDFTGDAEVITTGMDFCAISPWKVSNQRLCGRWLEALGAAERRDGWETSQCPLRVALFLLPLPPSRSREDAQCVAHAWSRASLAFEPPLLQQPDTDEADDG